jgi:hypothetical protein
MIDKPGPTRNNNSKIPAVTMGNDVAQGDKERPPPQGECCPRQEFGTVNDINVTDQLPPGVEDNHIHLTDDDAVFAPKFERLLKEK